MTREMKDSGIKWIGLIPKDWETRRIRKLATIRTGNTPSKSDGNTNFSNTTGIPWIKAENLEKFAPIQETEEYLTKDGEKVGKIFNPHTIFVGCIASVGKVGYSDVVCSCNQQINNIDFNNNLINWKYGFYALRASSIEHLAKANQSVQLILNAQSEGYISLSFPSLSKQQLIANYLDDKCSKIDEAASRQKAIVEKLKEYRKSVITEAVTHGLNPDVEMRDSENELLGSFPSNWIIERIKFIATVVRGGSPRPISDYLTDDINGLNWIKIGDATGNGKYINNTKQKIIPEGLTKTRYVEKNTLLLTNSMSFGHPYILGIDGCIHDGWLAFYNFKNADKEYIYYYLESDIATKQFKSSVDGSVVENLNIDKVRNALIYLPSLSEQQQIVDYLDDKCSKIDEAISRSNAIIEKLEEYKKSIIYEYVTGKKEVKEGCEKYE